MGNASSRRRIVWLYPKLTSWMGGPRFVFEVARRMNAEHEVALVSQRLTHDVEEAYASAGIRVINLDTPTFTEISFWLGFRRSIRRNAELLHGIVGPDDTVITSMFPMNCIAAEADLKFVQIAYEPFAMFFDPAFQDGQGLPTRVFSKSMAALHARDDIRAVGLATVLITLSEFERRNCLRVYGRDSTVVYEGVDTEFFYPRPGSSLRDRYAGHSVFFHSTGFDSFKGTASLIKAIPDLARMVPDAKVLVSQTRDDPGALARYRSFLERTATQDYVEFLGFVDRDLLPDYYSLADLYLEPGVGRSMSLSSKEANACGTASVRGIVGTEDTIHGETGILVDPSDPRHMAEDIAGLLRDRQALARMGSRARTVVLEKYTWPEVVRRIEACL